MSERRKRKMPGAEKVDAALRGRGLTIKQRRLVKARVMDPDATYDELASRSDYNSRQAVYQAMNTPAVQGALERCREIMEQREKLKLGALLEKLEEGLEATEIRSLAVDGDKLKVSAEVKDFSTRHKYLETALELKGLTSKDKEAAPTGPVNIAIILGGGGSEAEKAAVSEVLLATRIARGLHPLENRALTEQEAEKYRRPT